MTKLTPPARRPVSGTLRQPAPERPHLLLAQRALRFMRSPKGMVALIFLMLLALAGATAGWSRTLPHVATALVAACLFDVLAARLLQGIWQWPSGALISGFIVAFVLGPEQSRLVTGSVAALAVWSKYALRTNHGHVFNPAALAFLVSIPAFSTAQSWWGALADLPLPWLVLLLACGAFMLDRINKFPLALTFLAAYFSLFTVAAFLSPERVVEMFRPPFLQAALFLACFMLTDPPTSPNRERDQVVVGLLAAAVCCAAQLLGAGQGYLLLGVLAGNATLALWPWAAGTSWSQPASASGVGGSGYGPETRHGTDAA